MGGYKIDFGMMSGGEWAMTITVASCACVVSYVVGSWLLSRVFKKAKVARWKAWVPIVNIWNLFKIGGRKGWNIFWLPAAAALMGWTMHMNGGRMKMPGGILCVLAAVLALIGIWMVFSVILNVQRKLNKRWWFIFLYFINLIAPLWLWILALDSSKYNDKLGRRKQIK